MLKKIILKIKSYFGIYENGYQYMIKRKKIKIPYSYLQSKINKKKWQRKWYIYKTTGEFDSPIIIDRNFNLIDGYSSVKIAYLNNIDKVPVYFQ